MSPSYPFQHDCLFIQFEDNILEMESLVEIRVEDERADKLKPWFEEVATAVFRRKDRSLKLEGKSGSGREKKKKSPAPADELNMDFRNYNTFGGQQP